MNAKHSQNILCPACKKESSFKNSDLLNLPASPLCPECEKPLLYYFDNYLSDISPEAFTHKLDHQMLEALKKIPGVESVLRSVLRHSFELSMRLHHQGNYIQVSKKQLKSLHKQLEDAAKVLDIQTLPELYVVQDSRANAYTFGVEKHAVAISSGCLDLMSKAEVSCVLAHELGHIKAHHVLYKTAARVFSSLADSIAQKTLGVGGIVLMPIKIALLRWDRASELSSDRAALLVVKNPTVLLTTLMKLAGGSESLNRELNIQAFIDQAQNYERTQDEGPLGSYITLMNSMFNSHPLPIWRAQEIIDWVYSGDYLAILHGNYKKVKKLEDNYNTSNTPTDFTNTIDKTINNLRNWWDKNLNLPEDR